MRAFASTMLMAPFIIQVNGIAKDVIVNIHFIDTHNNQIRLNKTVILGDIGPGASKDFNNIPLEGKCDRKYSVNMTIAKIVVNKSKGVSKANK